MRAGDMSEFNSARALFQSTPKSLAAFMAAGAEHARMWRPEELKAIFQHQMSAPVLVDLGGFDPAVAARLKNLTAAQGLLLSSFLDLFLHENPPVELLVLTKDFAKANMDHPESSLPGEVAAVLYYAAIAAASVRLGERISQLSDGELRRGLTWAGAQTWVEPRIRQLLLDATAQFPPAQETR
jgi:hypothetical protein